MRAEICCETFVQLNRHTSDGQDHDPAFGTLNCIDYLSYGIGLSLKRRSSQRSRQLFGLRDRATVLPRILPQATPGGYRAEGLAQVRGVLARRERAVAPQHVQQVRDRDDLPQGPGRPRAGRKERTGHGSPRKSPRSTSRKSWTSCSLPAMPKSGSGLNSSS
jgi:hypothetical protein